MEMLHGMIKAKEADAQTIAKVAKETVATEERVSFVLMYWRRGGDAVQVFFRQKL